MFIMDKCLFDVGLDDPIYNILENLLTYLLHVLNDMEQHQNLDKYIHRLLFQRTKPILYSTQLYKLEKILQCTRFSQKQEQSIVK